MTKVIFFMFILLTFNIFNSLAGTLTVTSGDSKNEYKKAYFAGAAFGVWKNHSTR